jgi:predicted acyltransferase
MIYTKVAGPQGNEISVKTWVYQNLFASWASPVNASLIFAVVNILFWLFLMWLLYRKKIFIKI